MREMQFAGADRQVMAALERLESVDATVEAAD